MYYILFICIHCATYGVRLESLETFMCTIYTKTYPTLKSLQTKANCDCIIRVCHIRSAKSIVSRNGRPVSRGDLIPYCSNISKPVFNFAKQLTCTACFIDFAPTEKLRSNISRNGGTRKLLLAFFLNDLLSSVITSYGFLK